MKSRVAVLVVLVLLVFSVTCFADTAQKFQGGIRDVIMSPLQVSDNVKSETANAKFLPFALAGGFLKGSFYMAKQIVSGALNIVTSPLDSLHK